MALEVEKKSSINRREFFSYLSIGFIALSASVGGVLSLIFRYLYPNVVFEPAMDFNAGRPEAYDTGVDERWKKIYGVWIFKSDGKFVAMSNICTHLGCVPTWLSAERKFKCPCHGSGFYPNGINFEGPAPRPLERYKVFLDATGNAIVDKTRVFRYEKGEWSNPDSYISV
ncbi:MAG: ubiquinol-cytochrome c reductase iron-sulfur subunit [Bacteriovoracaceae bacterium]|nr:ubiquinol-cytochrome c reductase iron-sulfur subunit [Bacteriovoracaceae bacterium]